MGYRHYFCKASKWAVETIRHLGANEIFPYDTFPPFGIKTEDVYELGKLYWDDTADRIYDKGVQLFSKKETQDAFSDYCPYVVGKDGLLEAIKIYQEKVLDYYASLFTKDVKTAPPLRLTLHPEDIKDMNEIVYHFLDKITKMRFLGIADTDETHKWSVTSSWEYEYALFNLIHILKTMDWEKDTLLFYGR